MGNGAQALPPELWKTLCSSSFVVLMSTETVWIIRDGRGKNGMENESPGPPPCSHSSSTLSSIACRRLPLNYARSYVCHFDFTLLLLLGNQPWFDVRYSVPETDHCSSLKRPSPWQSQKQVSRGGQVGLFCYIHGHRAIYSTRMQGDLFASDVTLCTETVRLVRTGEESDRDRYIISPPPPPPPQPT